MTAELGSDVFLALGGKRVGVWGALAKGRGGAVVGAEDARE